MPLDPGRHWLAAGITGIPRQREWDAVKLVEAPGSTGDEVQFVALPDGRIVLEAGPDGFDHSPLAAALEGSIERPYRAVARRRPELWAVGACSIGILELPRAPQGDALEVVRTADGLLIRVDGMPSGVHLPELDELGAARFVSFVVRAQRLTDSLFEVEVEPL
ncbi:hypothetical protein BH20ACT14_BH20ACT14_19340 [soil metagenome]|nr:hypothetical protein [Actinomycetota bacterium]